MSIKRKLVDIERESVERGNILTVRGRVPYEEKVDFMVFEAGVAERPYGLIVSSGYKAGLILVHLPAESADSRGGINRKWLITNWSEWVYPDCDVTNVWWMPCYVAENERLD